MEKIVVYNLNWLGDILFSFPNLKALKKYYPNSHLSCIIPPQYTDLFYHHPYVDQVIPLSDKTILDKFRLWHRLKKEKWDMGFLFHRSKTRAHLLKWARVPKRVGYNTKNRIHLLTHPIEVPKTSLHKMDHLISLLENFGIQNIDRHYEYPLTPMNVSLPKPYIVFHPGSNWAPKQWPTHYFSQLGNLLQNHFKTHIVITGLKEDALLAQEISQKISFEKPIDLTGKTLLSYLANVFKEASLVIAGDTGPMHLAVASHAKVIALYGPTSPILNGPRGLNNFKVLWEKSGLNNLMPQKVFKEIVDWIPWLDPYYYPQVRGKEEVFWSGSKAQPPKGEP